MAFYGLPQAECIHVAHRRRVGKVCSSVLLLSRTGNYALGKSIDVMQTRMDI